MESNGKNLAIPHHAFSHEPQLKHPASTVFLFPQIFCPGGGPKNAYEEDLLEFEVRPLGALTRDHGICE
jgi:hypothetical protein